MASSTSFAIRRLRKELAAFHAAPPGPHIKVSCDEWNMLSWSFLLRGPPGTPYHGGWYWGRLQFPDNYPLAPPSVILMTPSGRFVPNTRICLSVSDFHPECWKPAWGFATVLDGLITFMSEDTPTVGSIDPLPPIEERRRLAADSAAWNSRNSDFRAAFPDFDAAVQELENSAASNTTEQAPLSQTTADTGQGQEEEETPHEIIPPELTCSICMKLLLEPVSVSCGHTFCRRCMDETLDYHSLCALCRAPLTGGQSVNILIQELVSQRCPRTLARRRAEMPLQQGMTTVLSSRAGPGGILPLLRCQVVLLPQGKDQLSLHMASEIQAVEHALRGARRLGILMVGTGGENAGADGSSGTLGCCVEVEEVRRPQAGRHACTANVSGLFRFRLLEESQMHEQGFELGRVEEVHDEPLSEERLSAAVGLANDASDLLKQQLADIGDAGRQAFRRRFGQAPVPTSVEIERFSFWLSNALVTSADRQQLWLQTVDTCARLEDCRSVLMASRGKLALNLPGADSWMNAGRSGLINFLILVGLLLLFAAKSAGILRVG